MPTARQLDALEQAEDIAFDAMDAEKPSDRLKLAQKALKVSELCADAWLILAEFEQPGGDGEFELLNRAVSVAEQALEPRMFEEEVGFFWDLLETRPYMRARLALAQALWSRGDQAGAIANSQALLRLNPNDSQGVRYQLASWLAVHGDGAGLRSLVADYAGDDSAFLAWPTTLMAFMERGEGRDARAALDAALASNSHVPDLLLGKKRLPAQAPSYYQPGGATEAVIYVQDFKESWEGVPGALEWLKREVAGSTASPS